MPCSRCLILQVTCIFFLSPGTKGFKDPELFALKIQNYVQKGITMTCQPKGNKKR